MDNYFSESTETPYSEMSQAAKFTLNDFFFNKVMALDNMARTDYRLTKQCQIKALKFDIEKSINANRYAFFEVVTLEPKCDDIENIDTGILVKNFRHFLPNREPDKFRIVINETWNGYTIYQRSIDDLYWNPLCKEITVNLKKK